MGDNQRTEGDTVLINILWEMMVSLIKSGVLDWPRLVQAVENAKVTDYSLSDPSRFCLGCGVEGRAGTHPAWCPLGKSGRPRVPS